MTRGKDERARRKRLKLFAERIADTRSRSVEIRPYAWKYLPVNPMSDEPELLFSLGLGPSDCIKVDAYFGSGHDVYSVQVHAAGYSGERQPGLYGRRISSEAVCKANFVVVVGEQEISTAIVERALADVATAIASSPALCDDLQRLA